MHGSCNTCGKYLGSTLAKIVVHDKLVVAPSISRLNKILSRIFHAHQNISNLSRYSSTPETHVAIISVLCKKNLHDKLVVVPTMVRLNKLLVGLKMACFDRIVTIKTMHCYDTSNEADNANPSGQKQ